MLPFCCIYFMKFLYSVLLWKHLIIIWLVDIKRLLKINIFQTLKISSWNIWLKIYKNQFTELTFIKQKKRFSIILYTCARLKKYYLSLRTSHDLLDRDCFIFFIVKMIDIKLIKCLEIRRFRQLTLTWRKETKNISLEYLKKLYFRKKNIFYIIFILVQSKMGLSHQHF